MINMQMAIKTKLTIWSIIFIIGLSGGVFYILKLTGVIKIGADAIVGCQNTRNISGIFGRAGSGIVEYNFFGKNVSINSKMMPFLDKV